MRCKDGRQSGYPSNRACAIRQAAIALALIENIQREDLSVIEQAAAPQRSIPSLV
jgi:ParB-like chromosome segregation protein Spo0J